MKKLLAAIHILALGVMLAACQAESNERASQEFTPFKLLHSGTYLESGSLNYKSIHVLNSYEQYESLLSHYSSDAPMDLSFNGHRVVVLDLGRQPTGGYAAVVKSVDIQSDHTVVHVQTELPGEGCAVTQAESNPYAFYLIRSALDVFVQESRIVKNCED